MLLTIICVAVHIAAFICGIITAVQYGVSLFVTGVVIPVTKMLGFKYRVELMGYRKLYFLHTTMRTVGAAALMTSGIAMCRWAVNASQYGWLVAAIFGWLALIPTYIARKCNEKLLDIEEVNGVERRHRR